MLVNSKVDELRQQYCDVWQLYQNQQPLSPLQQQICAVILEHPEYHSELEKAEQSRARIYHPELGESNPFLHMSLHLAIREQLSLDNPRGINEIYQEMLNQFHNPHTAQHQMMFGLSQFMLRIAHSEEMPEIAEYLQLLRELVIIPETLVD